MRLILLTLCLLLSLPAFAVTHPDEKLRDPALEARAVELTKTLRCVVCQNESIEESHADIARDLRMLVRTQIMNGKTDDEIIATLRSSYGDFILLDPPVSARTWILWMMPLFVLLIGGAMISPAIRLKRKRTK